MTREMMEALPDTQPEPLRRRSRYTPDLTDKVLTMCPKKWFVLRLIADCRILTLPQIALVLEKANPRPKLASEKSARRYTRPLMEARLIKPLAVGRAALAGPDEPNDETLLGGSAPNIYVPLPAGIKLLHDAGLVDDSYLKRKYPTGYGPKNPALLGHELMVRDARVWLERLVHPHPSSEVIRWEDGPDAKLPLPSGNNVAPDAWFAFRIGEGPNAQKLVGLVEADRRSDRNPQRWVDKVFFYAELFLKKDALMGATGYQNARVIVITPDEARRDNLAVSIAKECASMRFADLARRFWVATLSDLEGTDLFTSVWRIAGTEGFSSMLRKAGRER